MFARRAASFVPRVARSFATTSGRSANLMPLGVAAAGLLSASVIASSFPKEASCDVAECAAKKTLPPHGVYGTQYERTFIAVKPDGVHRNLVGQIIQRFEDKGYKLVGLKMLTPTEKFAGEHYEDLSARPFYPGLVKYFSSGPVVAMVWEGTAAISQGRVLLGATNPLQSSPGTIRGDFCISTGRNIIHGSDGQESAEREINMWFKPEEVQNWDSAVAGWVISAN